MKTWLVTGGAGFIGSNFVHMAYRQSDVQLIVLDALTYAGNLANLAAVLDSPRIRFVHGDISDGALVDRLFCDTPIDKVVHFAAESHVDRSILDATPFMKTNIFGTFTLLEAARRYWKTADGHCFLHVSTDEVFGTLRPEDPSFDEQSPYRPNSPYSASKAASDHLVRAYYHTYGVPTVISNCSNNYGPWQFPEKLIPLMITNAFANKPLPIYGDGLQIRDWLHVEDHCEALFLLLEHGKLGDTYMIGAQNEHTNRAIVEMICDAVDGLAERPRASSRALMTHVADRPGHDRRYSVNSGKMQRELGWKPRREMNEALGALVRWYRDHNDWLDAIRSQAYLSYYDTQYRDRLVDSFPLLCKEG